MIMAVRRLVATEGSVRAAKLLRISQNSCVRLRGGVAVRLGTLEVAAKSLADLTPPERRQAPAVRP
jgi:hypothetical protein